MENKISIVPKYGDKGIHVEILQQTLIDFGFNVGLVDGDFGNKTKNAIISFQIPKGLSGSGIVNESTLELLDLEVEDELSGDPIDAITSIVDRSGIARTDWANRGQAPYGYYYGMALTYAGLYARLRKNDVIAKELSKTLATSEQHDALCKYDDVFAAQGMSNAGSESDRLRHLFVLMFGLGLMESNGKHCAGWDRGKLNGWGKPQKAIQPTSTNSEAGLFQTSYDILGSVNSNTKSMLSKVFRNYQTNPDGFIEYFSKGVNCSKGDNENFGDGEGKEFQRLSKECPAFAVEFTAVALRNLTGHWNPVIKKGDIHDGLQIKKACDELLKSVQAYTDNHGFGASVVDLKEEPQLSDVHAK